MREKRIDLIMQIQAKLDVMFVSRFHYYCPALSLGSDRCAPPIAYYKSLLCIVDSYFSRGFNNRMFDGCIVQISDGCVIQITSTGFYDGSNLIIPCSLEYSNGFVIEFFTSLPSVTVSSVDWSSVKSISFLPIL